MNYSFNEARPALEVFHTGDSVRAYDFLGAHLVNRNDKNGVVSVCGRQPQGAFRLQAILIIGTTRQTICITSVTVCGKCLSRV